MPADKKNEDAGVAELQKRVDDAQKKGYIGSVPDANPNSAYSLASGPDAPPVNEADVRADVPAADKETK